jgi:pimeloyl-ACP methyl ester carboxylesterase
LASPAAASAAKSAASPQIVAATQSLRRGSLLMQRCEIGREGPAGVGTAAAYCASFDVPEDWQRPSGRHISLRVAIVNSQAARSEPDMVVLLDGGPGEAATEDYPALAPELAPLRSRRSILLLDQRGTGGSNALRCPEPLHESAHAPAARPDLAADSALLRNCLAAVRTHAAPEHYTTTDAVRDLEALRQALGAPTLDLLGISYGTRVAQQYAAAYPQAVRSIVLDSPVPNTLALGSEHARNLERALQQLAARCRADAPCQRRFGDPYLTLYRLRDRLAAAPPTVQLRDAGSFEPRIVSFTAADLVAVVRFYSYNPLTAALLPLLLARADAGDYAPLAEQKQWSADDLGAAISGGMELSVVCAEDADLLQPQPADATTLLGDEQIRRIKLACSIWPHGTRPASFHKPLRSSVPVLILSGQNDPVTPPAYGELLLRNLPQARLLLAAGQGHGVLGAGCMPKLIGEFIDAPRPRALDAECLQRLADTPMFLDFNGPAP